MKAATPERIALALLALAVLMAGIALAHQVYTTRHWGLPYEANTGTLLLVERGSPAAQAGLRAGDRLTALGLSPPGDGSAAMEGPLPVSVEEGDGLGVYWLPGTGSGPSWGLLAMLVVAVGLWLAGSLVGLGPSHPAGSWFALFALLGALALCCAASLDPPEGWAQWLIGPATWGAMVSYIWLQRSLLPHSHRGLVWAGAEVGLSIQALLVVVLLLAAPRLLGSRIGLPLLLVAGFDLLAMLVAAHVLAIARLGPGASAPVRRRVRLALLVGMAGWLPALALGWAPPMATLLGLGYIAPLSPYAGALGLVVLMLTYPAIVVRGDLYWLEVVVRRVIVTVVVGGALLGVAAALWRAVYTGFHAPPEAGAAIGAVLVLAALPAFEPARRRLQAGLDRRLDAAQPDYGPALQAVADGLLPMQGGVEIAAGQIARVLLEEVPALFAISRIAVWLRGAEGGWQLFDRSQPGGMDRPLPPALAEPPREPFAPPQGGVGFEMTIAPARPFTAGGVALCAPVFLGGELRGMLVLGPRTSQDPYRRPDRDALVLLARQVAAALQLVDVLADVRARNAELAHLTSRLARAREEERKHLSHELHDAVSQDLVAITRQLRRHQQGTLPDAIWQDMIAQAQEALAAIRRICNDLRPAILDMGLASALRDLVDRMHGSAQPIRVQLEIQGVEQRMDEEREFALYRVTQESLANVIKHARATEATVTICFGGQIVEVRVQDNGRGFVVPARLEEIAGDHLGLLGMRERLAGLGGMVQVQSEPGHGTSVCAQIPYVE